MALNFKIRIFLTLFFFLIPFSVHADDGEYQPYAEITGNTSKSAMYDFFVPLFQKKDRLFFTDLRLYDKSGPSFEGNIHAGYRKLLDAKSMVGFYGAFDRRRSEYGNNYSQATAGMEYWRDKVFVGGNVYIPEHKKAEITRNRYEKALPGVDATIGCSLGDLFVSLGGYHFTAHAVPDITGIRGGLAYTYGKPKGLVLGIFNEVGIETTARYDGQRGFKGDVGIRFRFGLPGTQNAHTTTFERHMTDPVRRDRGVVIVNRKKEEVVIPVKSIEPPASSAKEEIESVKTVEAGKKEVESVKTAGKHDPGHPAGRFLSSREYAERLFGQKICAVKNVKTAEAGKKEVKETSWLEANSTVVIKGVAAVTVTGGVVYGVKKLAEKIQEALKKAADMIKAAKIMQAAKKAADIMQAAKIMKEAGIIKTEELIVVKAINTKTTETEELIEIENKKTEELIEIENKKTEKLKIGDEELKQSKKELEKEKEEARKLKEEKKQMKENKQMLERFKRTRAEILKENEGEKNKQILEELNMGIEILENETEEEAGDSGEENKEIMKEIKGRGGINMIMEMDKMIPEKKKERKN